MAPLDSIRRKIQNKALEALIETEEVGRKATENNVHSFYDWHGTGRYERTYQLYNSVKSTGVSGSGNNYTATIYLDVEGTHYKVPNPKFSPPFKSYFTSQQVFDYAEIHKAHIAGKPYFWKRSKRDIGYAMYRAFKKRFD